MADWFQAQQPPQQQRLNPNENVILLTQSLIESCILKGYTKWEIVAELSQTNPQIKREMILEVWAKLESQNPAFFKSYEQFLKLKAQVADFNEIATRFAQDLAHEAAMQGSSSNPPGGGGSTLPLDSQLQQQQQQHFFSQQQPHLQQQQQQQHSGGNVMW